MLGLSLPFQLEVIVFLWHLGVPRFFSVRSGQFQWMKQPSIAILTALLSFINPTLVGGLVAINFIFPIHIGNGIIPIDSYFSGRGWVYNHQPATRLLSTRGLSTDPQAFPAASWRRHRGFAPLVFGDLRFRRGGLRQDTPLWRIASRFGKMCFLNQLGYKQRIENHRNT